MSSVDLNELTEEAKSLSFWQAHRFWLMIAGALAISFFLVLVAMNLYNSSGTAQLDLSRPEYEKVRTQVNRDTDNVTYPSSGELDEEALDQFRELFGDKAEKLRKGKYYSPDAMSDSSLGLPRIDG